MKDIYFDCETTGINPYCAEIITAYFEVYEDDKKVDEYYLKSQATNWCEVAESIHKISFKEMRTFDKKDKAFREFLGWLPKRFRFITYANKNTQLGRINFDVAILENELNILGYKNHHLLNEYKMSQAISIHTLAKKLHKENKFATIKRNNRDSFRQVDIYKALFNSEYNAHDAKDDVKALVRIHKKLLTLNDENIFMFQTL